MKYIFLFIALLILTSCHSSKKELKDYYGSQFDRYCECVLQSTLQIDSYVDKDGIITYDSTFDLIIKKKDSCKSKAVKYLDSLENLK